MPLPILNTRQEPSHSDLIRLFHKTENLWAEHIATAEALDVGTAYANSELADVWGTPGVRIHLFGKGPGWNSEKLVGLFTPFCQIGGDTHDLGLDLLSAFFIAHHHGGDLAVQSLPEPPGFVLHLPYYPDLAKRPTLEQDCLEKVFERFSHEEVL